MEAFNIYHYLDNLKEFYAEDMTNDPSLANTMLNIRCKIMLDQVVRLNIIPIGICSMKAVAVISENELSSRSLSALTSFVHTCLPDCVLLSRCSKSQL
jgi:hypothetical protein